MTTASCSLLCLSVVSSAIITHNHVLFILVITDSATRSPAVDMIAFRMEAERCVALPFAVITCALKVASPPVRQHQLLPQKERTARKMHLFYSRLYCVDECVGLLTWCAWKLENLSRLSESMASRISHDPLQLMNGQLHVRYHWQWQQEQWTPAGGHQLGRSRHPLPCGSGQLYNWRAIVNKGIPNTANAFFGY